MAFTFNGIGSSYHGTRWLLDGSYVTTKWAVCVFIPLFPIGSVRVLAAGPIHGSSGMSTQQLTIQPTSLDLRMVVWIDALEVGVAAVLVFLSTFKHIVW